MSLARKIKLRTKRRALRVRKKIRREDFPRISVFRSLKYIYAQIINDKSRKTLVSCSSLELKKTKGDKKERAHMVGKELAKRALEQGISTVVFDRGSYLYHGRVKSLAEGLKEGGLKI